jgi:hypothetical protein
VARSQQIRVVHRVVVTVGVVEVDVLVGGVVFVTSTDVVVVRALDEEVVAFELDEELEELDDTPDGGGASLWGVVASGTADEVVPSVATCSNRTGACSGGRLLVMPKPNNDATAAPRNAPTARRNGAPRWSSTPLPLSG